MDKYQERYMAHQERKKRQLMYEGLVSTRSGHPRHYSAFAELMQHRRSQRVFTSTPISDEAIYDMIDDLRVFAPSSCDRKAVTAKVITDRADKELLSGLLVGGVGWIHRADKILVLLADPIAYKAPGELEYMPYLDAGFYAMLAWLYAEAKGWGCAYVNPNVRDQHKSFLKNKTNGHIFCGALAIGHYDRRAK